MSPDFLQKEVLLPFSKADPFTPGAGLGLGLAQRMIEILGGKLAIASTVNKGTIVHVEIPLHLLNEDNESDLDELDVSSDAGGLAGSRPVRQDGIFLTGFDVREVGVRRVGKSLVRSLKQSLCRVVTEIRYASLIVAPKGVSLVNLAHLASQARPGVHIIILDKEDGGRLGLPDTPAMTPSAVECAAMDYLQAIPTTYLKRPLRPSIVSEILKPPDPTPHVVETFVSSVAGGPEATEEAAKSKDVKPETDYISMGRSSSYSTLRPAPVKKSSLTESEIQPSPPTTPDPSASFAESKSHQKGLETPRFVPPLRPGMHEQATDPLPAVSSDPPAWSDSSSSEPHRSVPAGDSRPELKEMKSTPAIVEVKQGGPLRGMYFLDDQLYIADFSIQIVLVVEDNGVNRKILTMMLKRTV